VSVSFFNFWLVALGGGIGSGLRYLGTAAAERALPGSLVPAGTLAVNVLGSFAIGVVGGYVASRGALAPGTRLFFLTGLLGGFTTYSAFAWESVLLGLEGDWRRFALNVGAQLLLGIGAAALGYAAGRAL